MKQEEKLNVIKPYKRRMEYAYAPGVYVVRELLLARPESVYAVYAHTRFFDHGETQALCAMHRIPYYVSDKYFRLINQKENTYVLAVFEKYVGAISPDRPHIVLVNPDDEGNLGAVVRTALGCGIRDIAVIAPAADAYNPRAIRASRGALYWVECQYFDSFEAYERTFSSHELFPFMLSVGRCLDFETCPVSDRFALVFGNESTGLPAAFQTKGQVFTIPQSERVDSLNVAVAMGIGTYIFARKNRLI